MYIHIFLTLIKLCQLIVIFACDETRHRPFGLVEVMWKVVELILNCRLTASITFHDFLRGFRAGCGTGTATLEANLIRQLAPLREEVLYVIFLDLHKAYDSFDRSKCLEILEDTEWSPKPVGSSGIIIGG